MPVKEMKPLDPLTDALARSHGPGIAVQGYVQVLRRYGEVRVDLLEKVEAFSKELGAAGEENASEGLAALKRINTHLARAREHANAWDLIVTDMLTAIADVRKVGRDLLKSCDSAHRKITDARDGTEAKMKEALAATRNSLRSIRAVAIARIENASGLAESLEVFRSKVEVDQRDFAADGGRVNAMLSGDRSWITCVGDDIDAVDTAARKDAQLVAEGAVAPDGITFAVIGSRLTGQGMEVGAGLTVLAICLAVEGGGHLISGGGLDLDKWKAQLASVESKLTLLKASVATFQNGQTTVDAMTRAAAEAADGAIKLALSWKFLTANLGDLVTVVDEAIEAGGDQLKETLDSMANLLGTALNSWARVDPITDGIERLLTLKDLIVSVDEVSLG